MTCLDWIARHPRTMAWIALMTTLTFLLDLAKTILEAMGVL